MTTAPGSADESAVVAPGLVWSGWSLYQSSRIWIPIARRIVHGGAIAALVDTVVVGAILSGVEGFPKFLATIDLHVHYLGAVVKKDVIAEAWVRRRGRSILYLAVDAKTEDGGQVAHGELSYRIVL